MMPGGRGVFCFSFVNQISFRASMYNEERNTAVMDAPVADFELVRRAQGGDSEAFGVLVERYQGGLYLFIRQHINSPDDARDVLAEAFFHAWRKITTFRGEAAFKTWLWRIVVNLCRTHQRRGYLWRKFFFRPPVAGDGASFESGWPDRGRGGDPQHYCELQRLKADVRAARSTLSRRESEVFSLKFDNSMKIDEIGGVLGLSENTVKVLLFRAARKLAKALKKYEK